MLHNSIIVLALGPFAVSLSSFVTISVSNRYGPRLPTSRMYVYIDNEIITNASPGDVEINKIQREDGVILRSEKISRNQEP